MSKCECSVLRTAPLSGYTSTTSSRPLVWAHPSPSPSLSPNPIPNPNPHAPRPISPFLGRHLYHSNRCCRYGSCSCSCSCRQYFHFFFFFRIQSSSSFASVTSHSSFLRLTGAAPALHSTLPLDSRELRLTLGALYFDYHSNFDLLPSTNPFTTTRCGPPSTSHCGYLG
ncbi:hypothetical protein LX36DRAFT_655381 [Colletotrichum falcatum]|nr:hypothetical protein LX36DRAFT_655381 [Colletotrichum falcatum]